MREEAAGTYGVARALVQRRTNSGNAIVSSGIGI